jgi:hypothetical protein
MAACVCVVIVMCVCVCVCRYCTVCVGGFCVYGGVRVWGTVFVRVPCVRRGTCVGGTVWGYCVGYCVCVDTVCVGTVCVYIVTNTKRWILNLLTYS